MVTLLGSWGVERLSSIAGNRRPYVRGYVSQYEDELTRGEREGEYQYLA